MPAVTMVAAWISADTGVGPSIASGNHTYSGICADFPAAPSTSSSAMAVRKRAPCHSGCWPTVAKICVKFSATERIRVGTGGVLLPYYSALEVAEVFRMLEALFPRSEEHTSELQSRQYL